jgi:transposase
MSPEAIEQILTDNQRLQESNRILKSENTELKDQLAYLRRMIFGQKRERFIPPENQTSLELGMNEEEVPVEMENISYERRKKTKNTPHGREEIPSHVPRKDIYIEPDFDTTGMEKLTDKITEQLEYKPPEFYATRYFRPVYIEVIDGERKIHCPSLPPLCIDKGKAGPTLVAHTMVAKGEDHVPINRIRMQIKRDCEMDIPLSSLDSWYARGCFWAGKIAGRLDQKLRECDYTQMDESPLKVMIKPTNGKSTRGYMWSRYGPEVGIAVFHYNRRWNSAVAQELIGPDYQGLLQTDGLKAYDALGKRKGIIHIGCHSHARRKFEKSLNNDKKRSEHVLKIYRDLFAIEDKALVQNMTPDERLALRREKSLPIMEEYKEWLDTEIQNVSPKNKIGKAILYALGHWKELTRFLEDGRIEISNNWIENLFRPFALGRRNWLFAGSEAGARRLAILYTVLLTCKLHKVNSFKYLSDVLKKLPARKEGDDIDDLLPMNWKEPDADPD